MTAPTFDLSAVRAHIAELNARKRYLQEQTYMRDEARALLAARIDHAAAEGTERIGRMVARGNVGEIGKAKWWGLSGQLDLMPLLAALLGADKMKALLNQHVKALPASMPAAERAQLLAEVEAELLELEEAEESHILELEALGQRPVRRGDASPAVVLRLRD